MFLEFRPRVACASAYGVAALLVACAWLHGPAAERLHAEISGSTLLASVSSPMFATHAPGDEDRLFIAQRGGDIRIFDLNTNEMLAAPFLSIPDIDAAGEGGLLGMAFHPDYASNGKFYVYVTVDNGGVSIDGQTSPFSSRIREYTVSGDPNLALSTPTEVMNWAQPRSNHNAGWIGFNPGVSNGGEQYLYIASGDGGKQGDPDNNAQTLVNDPLGKILRIDVDGDDFPLESDRNYAIPASNPFVGVTGDDEIWAYGLRNPFRASFDRDTGDFYIADVGQGDREEINRQLGTSTGGENYGWNRREGFISHNNGQLLPTDTEPIYDYSHGFDTFQGNSVTGGVVYRGPDPELQGQYLFGDFVSDNLWRFDPDSPVQTVERINGLVDNNFSSPTAFGEDAVGNVYFLTIGGGIYRIDTDALLPGDYNADGEIDEEDYAVWRADYGLTDSPADGNGDGVVDAADFALWRNALSSTGSGAATTVPEPGSLFLLGALLASGLLMTLLRHRFDRISTGKPPGDVYSLENEDPT